MTESDTELDRRNVLKLSGGGLAAMTGLAGCMGGGNGSSGGGGNAGTAGGGGSSGQATVKYWHKETGAKPLMREIATGFDGANLEISAFPESKMPSQLQSALATGSPPHVVQSKLKTAQQLHANDALSTKSAQNVMKRIGWDNWFRGPKSVVGGKDAYTVPWFAWLMMTFYREPVWKKKGLPKPTTWSNIEECARKLHDPENSKYGIGLGTKENYFTTECFQNFALANGGRVFNKKGEIVFDNKEIVEALEFYAHLHKEYGLPGQNSYPTIKQMYLNNRTDLVLWSDWLLPVIWGEGSREMAKNTSVVAYTKKKQRGTFGMVNSLSILNVEDSRTQKAAEDFVYYMQKEDKPYLKWLQHLPLGPNPSTKTTSKSKAYTSGKYAPKDLAGMFDVFQPLIPRIREGFQSLHRFGTVDGKSFPGYGQITNQLLIAQAVTRVIQGEKAQKVAEEQAEKMRNIVKNK